MLGATALLGLLGSVAILSLLDFGDDTDDCDTEEGAGETGETPTTVEEIILVENGTDHSGDAGRQAYLFDPEASGGIGASIDAGGGDDIVNLTRLGGGIGLVGGQVAGGAGNDAISVEGEQSTLSGGAGNDTILGELSASEVNGDGGDDSISVVSGPSDASTVNGGDGDDTIDGSGSDNISLLGGAGNDSITTEGGTPVGTGYRISADGGDGDDTLTHEVDVFPLTSQDPAFAPAFLTGGDGADAFELRLTFDNGVFSPSAEDPDVFETDAAVITDFEQGTDTLSFDLSGSLAGYSVMTGTLVEDTDAGSTEIILRLSGGSLPDQDVRVTVATTGLSWDDVSFIGTQPGTLTPVAA